MVQESRGKRLSAMSTCSYGIEKPRVKVTFSSFYLVYGYKSDYMNGEQGMRDHNVVMVLFLLDAIFGLTLFFVLALLRESRYSRGTYHLHGKTGNSSWKIKWFTPSRLGSFRTYGL